MTRPGWDEYFLGLVDAVALRATCPKRAVGAVLVNAWSHRLLSTGYNGAPFGVPHCTEWGDGNDGRCAEIDGHCALSLHAEINAILYAQESLAGAVLYTTYRPCLRCTLVIAQVGIVEIVYRWPYERAGYEQALRLADWVLGQSGVQCRAFAGSSEGV